MLASMIVIYQRATFNPRWLYFQLKLKERKAPFGIHQTDQSAFSKPPADKYCAALDELFNTWCEWEMTDEARASVFGALP